MNLLKYFVLFSIVVGSYNPLPAQDGIQFSQSNWAGILAEAKQTGKLIFMDAHTSWCGPCKWMQKNVFPDKAVGFIYNRNFINAYIDMEKDEGIELRKKYDVHFYPTLLYINGDGEVVHKIVGQTASPDFIQHALDALSPKRNLKYFTEQYARNSSKYDFVDGYLKTLKQAYEVKDANKVALNYLQQQDSSTWSKRENWLLLQEFVTDPTSDIFQYLVNQQQNFSKLYGDRAVENKIFQTYVAWPAQYVQYPENAKPVFDESGFNSFLAQLKSSPYKKKNEIEARSKLTVAFGMKDYVSYAKTVSEMLKDSIIPTNAAGAEWLYGYADIVYRFSKDKAALAQATEWAKRFTEASGINAYNKATYLDLYANLLEATGKTKLAAQVRSTIDQKVLKEAKEGAPFQQMRIVPKQS